MTIKIHNETSINSWNVISCKKNKVDGNEYTCSNCKTIKKSILKIFFVDNEGYDQYINFCKKCVCKMHNIFKILDWENDSEH